MMILASGMWAMSLVWVTCSLEISDRQDPLMGISLDGMSAMLLTWVACSKSQPLMGTSLDWMSAVSLTCVACSAIAIFLKTTGHVEEIEDEKCIHWLDPAS